MRKILFWMNKLWEISYFRLFLGFVGLFLFLYLLYLLTVTKIYLVVVLIIVSEFFIGLLTLLVFLNFVYFEKNSTFVEVSYSTLNDWVQKHDIGNATNLVKSLSSNPRIREYFWDKNKNIRLDHKEKNKKFKVPQKYGLLIESIPEIVSIIDEETVDSLIFLKTYIDFEPKNKSIQEKTLNGVLSVAFVGGFLGVLKYGIDFLSVDETYDLGYWILFFSFLFGLFVLICALVMYSRNSRERNARNFLLLVFKAIEHKKGNEQASKAILELLTK